MELHLAAWLAFANPFLPIIDALRALLTGIFSVVHNYGWSLILLAAFVKLAFWPLNTMQFKSMLKMQQLQPKMKALQQRYKDDKVKLNEATMALYKESGANPAAGCAPMLLQLPILISLYWAVIGDKAVFASQKWLWIGSPFSANSNHILATSLANPDYVLLGCYIVSMYFSVRLTTPSSDPQQAQQQKIMAFISPVMIGYFGFRYAWPSAIIIYWLAFNVFTMAQQLYLIRKYHTNPSGIGPHPEAALTAGSVRNGKAALAGGGEVPVKAATGNSGGSRAARRRRSSRR